MTRAKPPERNPASLSTDQMRSAIKKVGKRIADLEAFDIGSIRERWDPAIEAIKKKVNSTLQEALGYDTIEYHEYSISSLDTLPLIMGGGAYPIEKVHAGYRAGIERARLKLETLRDILKERLEDASGATLPQGILATARESTRRVFVVHGHDDGLKETVARYLSSLELQPVVLHEQPNQGKTIIEKFEKHADVDFAVVIFTPDDVGYSAGNPEQSSPRARQNVVLELGFFIGALGRNHVCVLHTGDIELPSDYSGVLYLPLDAGGAWRFRLAKEMKASGMHIDLNLVG
jgi:predicted nucleotide-binding protein